MKDSNQEDLELTPALALRAYSIGVFPMAEERNSDAIYWVEPRTRGILPLDAFHIPKRLRRTIRQGAYEIRTDTAFDAVIDGCAETSAMPGREDSWINQPIRQLFRELFDLGHVHTIECWQGDALLGGLYGLAIGGAFFGESMFSRATDASKVALTHLAARLDYGGYTLLDAQFPNPHLTQFGAIDISRKAFRRRLDTAIHRPARWPRDMPEAALMRFVDTAASNPRP